MTDLPGGSVGKTSPFNAGPIPGQGTKIPHTLPPKNQNIKQKRYCNKLNKYLKNGSHKKKCKKKMK